MQKKFPVDDVVVPLRDALLSAGCAILEAPPGAGKSTRVPLRLLDHFGADQGRILMLEPRRVAARSVATFMASQLGEPVGKPLVTGPAPIPGLVLPPGWKLSLKVF